MKPFDNVGIYFWLLQLGGGGEGEAYFGHLGVKDQGYC